MTWKSVCVCLLIAAAIAGTAASMSAAAQQQVPVPDELKMEQAVTLDALRESFNRGRYPESAGGLERLLQDPRALNPVARHEALQLLGQAHTKLARYPEALAALGEAQAIAERLDLRQGLAYTFIYMGDAYERMKRHGDALTAHSLDYLGCFFRSIGDAKQAIRNHERAIALAQKLGDTKPAWAALARAYNHLGLSWQVSALREDAQDRKIESLLSSRRSGRSPTGAWRSSRSTCTGCASRTSPRPKRCARRRSPWSAAWRCPRPTTPTPTSGRRSF